jgi:hypothetical protein
VPTEVEEKAINALVNFGGCSKVRAERLLEAWQKVFAAEALGVVAGVEKVTTSVTDLRVERVKLLVDELDENSPLPNEYELGVLMRVPPSQARTALRNWRARYPDHYEDHMKVLAASGDPDSGGTDEDPTHLIAYRGSDVLEYAVDCLRRKGLQRGLKVDKSALSLEIPETTVDADGNDALKVLGI